MAIKALNPQRLYNIGMWLVSLVFASFLLGLGDLVIKDLPNYETLQRVAPPAQLPTPCAPTEVAGQTAATPPPPGCGLAAGERQRKLLDLEQQRETAAAAQSEAKAAFNTANESHQNWLRTRAVTSSSKDASEQDPELLERTRIMQQLSDAVQSATQAVAAVEQQQRAIRQAEEAENYERYRSPAAIEAQRSQQLRAFLIRLALTLPLLCAGIWMFRTKRQSAYWPLYRGFLIFSVYAFFFELVPYLPSYGGYVRQVVGLVLCLAGGHYGIRWMQAYLKRREEEERRNEEERRRTMNRELAIQKMEGGLCPGCDRAIKKPIGGEHVNHCVHCGLKLFDICGATACGTRKNAYYAFCQSCGSQAHSGQEAATKTS